MKQVTPMREYAPERSYIQIGTEIKCFKVLSVDNGIDQIIHLSDDPIFTIKMPSEESARLLIEDLYYGEYTGA